ncbi:MAG: FKBP-type peptidyl-prolyl cis-trans isomerase [Euryarchaeota archaeon]|nr:FKBP-type peptidyl-prolyl cis-trans isomerase [Euryarchaeota archaeon]
MKKAQKGNRVLVHFTSTLNDGTIAETSLDREPDQVTIGEGLINPAFEEALIGMTEGESKKIFLPVKKAYGKYRKKLVFKLKRKNLNLNLPDEPEPGQVLRLSLPTGQKSLVTVKEVTTTILTVDANHPFAGKDLWYEIKLVQIAED